MTLLHDCPACLFAFVFLLFIRKGEISRRIGSACLNFFQVAPASKWKIMVKLRHAAHRFGGLIISPRAALSSLAATPRHWTSGLRPVHGIWRRRLRLHPACLEPAVRRRDRNRCRPDAD